MSFPEYELIEPSRLRPELRKVATPSLDEVIVEFLKQYEVNVIPIRAQGAATSAGTNAMLGAVGGVGMKPNSSISFLCNLRHAWLFE